MFDRMVSLVLIGLVFSLTAAVLTVVGESAWVVFGFVFVEVVMFGLIREALREPEIEVKAKRSGDGNARDAMPEGFGRAMLEQVPVALMVISDRGRVLYGNAKARELSPAMQRGAHFANILRAPHFVEAVNAVIADGQNRSVKFSSGIRNDKYYKAIINPIPPDTALGHEAQLVITITDRTQDRQLERIRSDFLANASHELRTPLASIIGYVETLIDHADDEPETRRKFLKIVAKQASRLQRLVDDMMWLNRIEANAHQKPVTPCNLQDIALEAYTALIPLQQEYGVTLRTSLVAGEDNILGNRDELNQVMVNLIDNAMKYSRAGAEVAIYEAAPNPLYPDKIGITVEDRGEGIAPEHLSRLTERFYRVNVLQSQNKGGTGLGLAIVKHILNRHGGELQIESVVGTGSRFTIWLPAREK